MALVLFDKNGALAETGSAAEPPPSQINMDDLLAARRKTMRRKHSVYKRVLQLCHRRIRFNARRRPDCTWCVFQIPSFVPGLPRYNLDGCMRYCLSKLKQNGFDITYVPPQTLVISWQKFEAAARKRAKDRRRKRRALSGLESLGRRCPAAPNATAPPPRRRRAPEPGATTSVAAPRSRGTSGAARAGRRRSPTTAEHSDAEGDLAHEHDQHGDADQEGHVEGVRRDDPPVGRPPQPVHRGPQPGVLVLEEAHAVGERGQLASG